MEQAERQGHRAGGRAARVVLLLMAATLAAACSPTVRVQAPDEPIEINLNVRIEQEVRVRIDRELEEAFQENDDIF
ncbi:MAG: YnbE family lipoprotein [Alphaproteobacteria bacterium]|nr:YnbE family lipoprotein [Alphaproteobacteria bacterium]